MAEPTSSAVSTLASSATGALAGAGFVATWPRPDLALMSGVFCGALLFLLRSKEPSWFKKALYFCISLVGGYAITPTVQHDIVWLPPWGAAFLSAAIVVTLAVTLLDWSETSIPGLLTQFVQRLIGGKND